MTKRGTVHTEEDYLELYARLGLEPGDFVSQADFQAKLRKQLWYEPTTAQLGMFEPLYYTTQVKLARYGITPVYDPKVKVGPQVKYYVTEYPGSFTWPQAKAIYEARSGLKW